MDFDHWFNALKTDDYFDYKKPFYWLDTGNSRKTGQLLLGSKRIEQPSSNIYKTCDKLKTIVERFGDIVEHDTKEQQGDSCSYRIKLSEQSLFINDLVSVLAGDLLLELLIDININKQGAFVNMESFKVNPIQFN